MRVDKPATLAKAILYISKQIQLVFEVKQSIFKRFSHLVTAFHTELLHLFSILHRHRFIPRITPQK